jgi:hypothetical protein
LRAASRFVPSSSCSDPAANRSRRARSCRRARGSHRAHRRLRRAVFVLWVVGAGLAGATALIAAVRTGDAAQATGYAVTAALLIALASRTAPRVAAAIGLVLCALQPLAVVVTA